MSNSSVRPYDCVIVGGGIVGLAVAMKLLQRKNDCRVAVIEKEKEFGLHQTGHNSGVIHSGIYYKPGSLKAHLCVEGANQLIRFCVEQGVPHEICGKIVVACEPAEIPFLQELHRRGTANGIQGLRLLSPEEVREHEPHVNCIQGMLVPTTGIVEFRRVAQAYARVFQSLGGELLPAHKVAGVRDDEGMLRIHTSQGVLKTRFLANCSGLYADHVARLTGLKPPCRIVPFRGEYYEIAPERANLVRTLIYPVPDPRFPFLGVHFTRMVNGKVEAGPNAVLAWAREGYAKSDLSPGELLETLSYPGFWRLAARYWRPAFQEIRRSYSKTLFHKALQKLVPAIRREDLIPGGAGVRAQALRVDGSLLDDFLIVPHGRSIHVLNAPSPAATSSLAIADHILRVGLLPVLQTGFLGTTRPA
jgi:(S)-2-hydroxyglutarate dehydrogenase